MGENPLPAILVTKTPATQQLVSGGTANFDIVVTNTGNVALSDVQVSDPGCELSGPANGGTLQPGEHLDYTCSSSNVTSSYTNTVTVHGTPPAGPDVNSSASAEVTVDLPLISVLKTADTPTAQSGGTATFSITVTNAGSVALGNIQVSDDQCTTLDGPANGGALQPGEHLNYTCTITNVTQDVINNVGVCGVVTGGPTVCDDASATVTVRTSAPLPVTQVPTMTEWGMIIFMALAGLGSVYYLRRARK